MRSQDLSTLLHRALESRLRDLLAHLAEPGWQVEADPLHQVRVASRRVRAVLDLVDRTRYPAYEHQARTLRRLTRALGRTRALDVQTGLLARLKLELAEPELRCALEYAQIRRATRSRKARAAMTKALGRISWKRLPRLLEAPRWAADAGSGDLGRAAWACLGPWLERALAPLPGLLAAEDGPALHDLRIRVKRLRYALETLAPAFQRSPETQLQQLRALQQTLGHYHDLDDLAGRLRAWHRALAGGNHQALASGTAELIARLAQERRAAYAQFQLQGPGLSSQAFQASLQRNLSQPEGDPS